MLLVTRDTYSKLQVLFSKHSKKGRSGACHKSRLEQIVQQEIFLFTTGNVGLFWAGILMVCVLQCHPRDPGFCCQKLGQSLVKCLSAKVWAELLCTQSSAVFNLSDALIPNTKGSRFPNFCLPQCICNKGKVWIGILVRRSNKENLLSISLSEIWSLYNHTFSGISKPDSYCDYIQKSLQSDTYLHCLFLSIKVLLGLYFNFQLFNSPFM